MVVKCNFFLKNGKLQITPLKFKVVEFYALKFQN